MINVDLQTKNRSKYLHTNTMFHKCSTHEVRDTDLIFLVLTHTLCSCEPNQSPWQPQSMFPLGGVMVGVQDTEAIQNERKRQIEREQCAYLKRWARSQNNSSINRAGGMMPHLHKQTHTYTRTIKLRTQTRWKTYFHMHFLTQFNLKKGLNWNISILAYCLLLRRRWVYRIPFYFFSSSVLFSSKFSFFTF